MQPKFIQYRCEWKGCKASLNNLETLRKHIRIVHAEEVQRKLCCQWAVCGTRFFRTHEPPKDLDNHFATAHLPSLEWRLGDGPQCRGVVTKVTYPLQIPATPRFRPPSATDLLFMKSPTSSPPR
ncbi:hypothetical protein F5883DRAFT_571181 [Diaporthe sp. PMI_573]|nr:hypothetical protein F5883DRAFT_571181 [Diaporthaceae sp. PMI_573]